MSGVLSKLLDNKTDAEMDILAELLHKEINFRRQKRTSAVNQNHKLGKRDIKRGRKPLGELRIGNNDFTSIARKVATTREGRRRHLKATSLPVPKNDPQDTTYNVSTVIMHGLLFII